jgi:hypothetical protein
MFNNILRNLSFGRIGRPAPRPYGKMSSGVLLPALAYFGWKYRDRIKSFVRGKMGHRGVAHQTSTGMPQGSAF